MRIAVLIGFISMGSFVGRAQNQNLIWPQLMVRTNPEYNFSYDGLLQVRFSEKNSVFNLAALTNTIYYKHSNLPMYYGADYTFVIADSGKGYRQIHWIQPKIEYRPKVSNLNFLFRLMYAHLWIYDWSGSEYKAEDNRIRILCQVNFPISSKFNLTINDECFLLGRNSWMRENRFQCNVATKIDTQNTIALGYFYRWVGSTERIKENKYENAITVLFSHCIFK